MLQSTCETQPNCDTVFTIATVFLTLLCLFFCGNCSLSLAFGLAVVRQPYDAGTNTCPRLYNPFQLCRIDTWEDANIHQAIASKYLSKNLCTVVEEWTQWLLLPRILLFLDTLRPRDTVHDRNSHAGNCIGLLANIGLYLSTGNKYLFLLRTPLNPFRLLTTAPVLIFPCLASKFRNRSFDDHCLCLTSRVSGIKIP